MLSFLKSTPAKVVTLLLLVQAGMLYSSIRDEYVPEGRPLAEVPLTLGNWDFVQDGVVEKEVRDILQADDILNRLYRRGNTGLSLFIAAFRSQRTGKAPHSPKNCLPGSGWEWVESSEVSVDVGRPEPIPVNRYVVAHGDQRALVYYWYQSRDRAVASEYKAKFWVLADSIRYNRTDTALVRVVVEVDKDRGFDEAAADGAAQDFIRTLYSPLLTSLPS